MTRVIPPGGVIVHSDNGTARARRRGFAMLSDVEWFPCVARFPSPSSAGGDGGSVTTAVVEWLTLVTRLPSPSSAGGVDEGDLTTAVTTAVA